jgi:hypothetical protein
MKDSTLWNYLVIIFFWNATVAEYFIILLKLFNKS